MTDTAITTDPADPTAVQDGTAPAPEDVTDESDHHVEEVDVDALIEEVKSKNLLAYGVLAMAANARKDYQSVAKQLADAAQGKDNFESLITKHSSDEKMGQLNAARVRALDALNKIQAAQVERLSELGVTSTALTEQEKAALKEKRTTLRATLKNALSLFAQFAENVEGAAEFIPIADKLALEKGATTASGTATESGAIREWAAKNNVKVSERGRIPAAVVEQYKAAMAKEAEKAPAA